MELQFCTFSRSECPAFIGIEDDAPIVTCSLANFGKDGDSPIILRVNASRAERFDNGVDRRLNALSDVVHGVGVNVTSHCPVRGRESPIPNHTWAVGRVVLILMIWVALGTLAEIYSRDPVPGVISRCDNRVMS